MFTKNKEEGYNYQHCETIDKDPREDCRVPRQNAAATRVGAKVVRDGTKVVRDGPKEY